MSHQTAVAEAAPPKPASMPTNLISSLDIVEVLQRQLWLLLAATSLGILGASIYWSRAASWYETRAKMLVTAQDPRLMSDPNSSKASDSTVQDDVLANHMEIVSGRELLKLALAHQQLSELPSIVAQLDEETDAVDYVSKHLLLTKGGQGTARDARTLNIAFRHTDADDALIILNAIVAEYEASLNSSMSKAMETATRLIEDARTKVEGEIKELQAKYVAFSQSTPSKYRHTEGHSNTFQMQMQMFQTTLTELASKRALAQTRLESVTEALQRMELEGGVISRFDKMALIDSDTFERLGMMAQMQAAASHDPRLQMELPLRNQAATLEFQKLIELQGKLAERRANFGANHDSVRAIQGEIDLIKDAMQKGQSKMAAPSAFSETTPEEMLGYYRKHLINELRTLDQARIAFDALSAEAEEQAKKAVEFEVSDRIMQSDIERKVQLYGGIVEHLQTLNTASGLAGFVHQRLEAPERGEEIWPSLPLCLIAGSLLGLVAGMFLAIMNDQMDKRFRSAAEIDQLTGVPVIAQVGRIRHSRDNRRTGRMIVDSQAPEAESFRLLRTFLLKDVKSGRLKVLSGTSCQTKDGKSTILANTAAKFAETGLRTLIIDGDMRAPTTHRFFNIPVQNGLSEILQGKTPYKEALKSTGIDNLSAITAGAAVRNPAELLQSGEFDDLLHQLRSEFDLIVVDSGPILWVSDPAIVAQKADATLLVVRSSADTKRKVQEAVRRLQAANANLRGCVLNTYGSTKEFAQDTYYSSPYHYYFGGYGRRVKDALGTDDASPGGEGRGNGHNSSSKGNGANGNGGLGIHSLEKLRHDKGTGGNGQRVRLED